MYSIYLHGWCSSPQSTKAQLFQRLWQMRQCHLFIPDFNQPDFFNLTLSRQIQQVKHHITAHSDVTLIGSSLGALTALWLAETCPQVQRLILLAPALNFADNAQRLLTFEQANRWRNKRQLAVYHYATQTEQLISYGFCEDIRLYPDQNLQRNLPTLLLHGKEDKTIPHQDCLHFVQSRPWIQSHILQSDHGLGSVFTDIERLVDDFLGF
jgi:pimeloyl-ACP methyl ester carboxylesterase